MQNNIHPNWNQDVPVTCACGNTFTTGSTYQSLEVDICSACHPFFTGEMKFVDTQGRVDKFMQKMEKAKASKNKSGSSSSSKKADDKQADEQKTYKQLLQEQKTAIKQAAA